MSLVTSPTATLPIFVPPPYPVRRFSVAEYHRMLETGILSENDRVELLEGCIVPKMTRSPGHDRSIELVDEALRRILPTGWRIRIQSAITTSDSEPEPDLAVVIRGAANRHPEPSELGLVIEVSESTLTADRDDKGRLFARAKIPIYWIVNLVDSRVEVYTDPTGVVGPALYRRRQDYDSGSVAPLVLDGTQLGEIAVSDLLP